MTSRRLLLAASTALLVSTTSSHALEGVVASIKPIHSLVAAVMEGTGEPSLIVEGAASPHGYAMRPSQAAMLQEARLVFWIGEGMETFLTEPLETLSEDATVVELGEGEGLVKLPYREDAAFETDGHDGHEGHDDHDDETEAAAEPRDHDEHAAGHDDHAGEETAEAEDDHDAGHEGHADHADEHAHGAYDMHLWLDPENAKQFVGEIETALAAADPANAAAYAANAQAVRERLDDLVERTRATLDPVRDKDFVVFHDAYHYFENRFDIEAAGSITVTPDVTPGARRISEIRERIAELGAACVFAEPQFEPSLVSVVTEGTGARSGILDPLGAELDDGPGLYFELIDGMAGSLAECLAEPS